MRNLEETQASQDGNACETRPGLSEVSESELRSVYDSVVAIIQSHLGGTQEKQLINEILAGVACGVVVISPEAGVISANSAARSLMGLSASDEGSLAEVAEELGNIGLAELLDGDPAASREFIVKSGQERVLKVTSSIIRTADKPLIVVSIWDNTARQQHDEAITEFISSISHELRTPLTTIQNSVSNILAGVTGKITPKTTDYLQNMLKDCSRLASLVNDLLDMAKLDSGKMPINRSATELSELVCRVVDSMRESAEAGEINLKYSIMEDLSPVYVDPQRIHQVLMNLVKNAIKFTPSGGSVTVSLHEEGDSIVAAVEDTGVGISSEVMPHVFNKFYQAGRKAGPGYNGCGLGLAICKQVVAAHGGKIWVESEGNKGSKFFVSLPKADVNMLLGKHIAMLADNAARKGGGFALMRIAAGGSADEGAARELVSKVAAIKRELVFGGGDLMLRTADNELMVVITETDESFLRSVKQRIMSVAGIDETNSFNAPTITPITKLVLFPRDAGSPERLIEMVRENN